MMCKTDLAVEGSGEVGERKEAWQQGDRKEIYLTQFLPLQKQDFMWQFSEIIFSKLLTSAAWNKF